jgi:acetyl-CoA synthetase
MYWKPIKKSQQNWSLEPNLLNYEETHRIFSWTLLDDELKGSIEGKGFNIADIAIDRHAESPRANQTALRFLTQDWSVKEFTYRELKGQTNRFANVLQKLAGYRQRRPRICPRRTHPFTVYCGTGYFEEW